MKKDSVYSMKKLSWLILLIFLAGCISNQEAIYNVDIAITPFPLEKGVETNFNFKILDVFDNPAKLELEHERYVHVLSVREDLEEFKHLHHEDFGVLTGENIKNSEFSVKNTFEKAVKYYIVFEFKTGGKDLHNQIELEVEGDREKLTFNRNTETTKTIMGYSIELIKGGVIKAGEKTDLMVKVVRDGKPVINFENYLGTRAHAVVWKEDLTNFMHAHAYTGKMDHSAHGSFVEGDIPLQLTFPEHGYYKLFVQFKHENEIITSDFTLEVL